MNKDSFHIIQEKLETFLKKYYWHQIVKGAAMSVGYLSLFFVSVILLEHYGRLSSTGRGVLFFSLISSLIYLLGRHVVWPAFKLFKLAPQLKTQEVAKIVGNHFPEINDKLLNTIQLSESKSDNDLIIASINQKAKQLSPFNFGKAIQFDDILKVGKIAIIPVVIIILMSVFNPVLITNSTKRIVNYTQEFVPQNPFDFELKNKNQLNCIRNENFPIEVLFKGDKIPQDVFLEIDQKLYRFSKSGLDSFHYLLSNLQNSINFRVKMGEYYSPSYRLHLEEKPVLKSFEISLDYPQYIGKENEKTNQNGSLRIPEGTKINWNLTSGFTDDLLFVSENDTHKLNIIKSKSSHFIVAKESFNYDIICYNELGKLGDKFNFKVQTIKDEHPQVQVKTIKDSIHPFLLFFEGEIKDDYGFNKLTFNFSTKDTSGAISIPINKTASVQNFRHYSDLSFFKDKRIPSLDYYFEVWDNDGVNGSKSVKSNQFTFEFPSDKAIDSLLNDNNESIKEQLAQNLSDAQDLQNEFSQLKKLMLEKKKLDWSDKSKIENFLEKQKELEQNLMKLNQENEKNNFQKEQLSDEDKRILEKQQRINELFEQLMDDEMKELYEELEKMMEDMSKEETEEQLEEINMKNEELEKELDRTLELFKQMEFDEKLEKTIEKLDELSKEQEKLAEETKENKDKDSKELSEEQEKINEKFEDIKKELDDLKKKNEELEKKKNFENTDEGEKKTQEQLNKAKEELGKNNRKKSSKSQKKASEEMQSMSMKLQAMQMQMQAQQESEDLNTLRQILENLITLSVDQEDLFQTFKETNRFDPRYPELTKVQGKLKDNAQLIEDSLLALSKRQMMLKSIINKEILDLNRNLDKSIEDLRERRSYSAVVYQQYVMTSANNLALLLDESIQQMQNSMKSKSFGSGSCTKPGGSTPKEGMKSLKQMQQSLKKQMEQMKKQMQGKGSQPGKEGKKGKSGQAKGFAKMAAQQSAIRQKLGELNKQLKKGGKTGLGEHDKIQNTMEQIEKDLLNKNITPETIRRQEQILSKLLEAEKSMREREFDKKRESKEGKNKFNRNLSDFMQYKSIGKSNEEMLKTVPPALNLFYKQKVNEYFNTFGK